MANLPALCHPEIELRVVDLRENHFDHGSMNETSHQKIFLDMAEVWPEGAIVTRNTNVDSLAEYFQATNDSNNANTKHRFRPLRIIFVEDRAYGDSMFRGENGRPRLNRTALWIHQYFGVSLAFFQHISLTADYRVTGNGFFTRHNDDGDGVAIDGFYSNSHGLNIGPAHIWFSHSLIERYASVYVIYNSSESAKKLIISCAESQPLSLLRPIAVDAFMEEDYLEGWTERLGQLRPRLIHYENDIVISTFTPSQSTKAVADLHNLSQHLHVARDNFIDLKEKLQFLQQLRQQYLELSRPRFTIQARDIYSVTESLTLIASRGSHGLRWASNYNERTGIRINLFFNLATQADSRTNLDIAQLTSKISAAAQRDSSSMITMAAVTMFFLPGSFVSALFSMVFFNTESTDGGQVILSVTPQWWLFPIVAIPLTALVFITWVMWRKRRDAAAFKDVEEIRASRVNDHVDDLPYPEKVKGL